MKIVIKDYDETMRSVIAALWYDSYTTAGLQHDADTTVASLTERLGQEIATGWIVHVAMLGDQLAGFLAYSPAKNYLNQLFVAPDAQGVGVGQVLLDFAKAQMPTGFHLRTNEKNFGARRFYLREGLVLESIVPHPRFGDMTAVYKWL